VSNLRSGKPVLEYTPALAAMLQQRGIKHSHVSITDERGMASATVILEAD
jgi:phosphopantetheinyl transferase (holo-ACP synthase)